MTEISGQCFCGAVRYQITGVLHDARSCHCSRCRKAFSAQASAYALVDPDDFRWIAGEALLSTYTGAEGFGLRFCSRCGSTLCGTYGGRVHGVTLGCVDGDPGIEIARHIYVGSKAPWEALPDGILAYEEGPDTVSAPPSARSVVREFWRLMASNDFRSVMPVLDPEFVMEWPQSNERIRGPERFCQMNAEYPTTSRWQFRINHLVAGGDSVVTQVSVDDGTQSGEPISFFTVRAGRIVRLVEYWPEPFAPAENRRHLVEPIPDFPACANDGGGR